MKYTSTDDLQMRAVECPYYIITTEVHDARNLGNELLCEEIGYGLTQFNSYPNNVIRSLYQPKILSVSDEIKSVITYLEEIPLTNVVHVQETYRRVKLCLYS